MGRPRKSEGEAPTREKILDAAIDLFAEKGFAGSSMRDIAKAAGLSEGALYRHYAGKDALLEAVLSRFDAAVFEPLPAPYPGASCFRTLLGGLPGYLAEHPRVARTGSILLGEARFHEGIRAFLGEAMGERGIAALAAIFGSEIAAGRLAARDPLALARTFNALRLGWIYGSYLLEGKAPGGSRRAREELEGIIAALEEGFCERTRG
jgi:AcrR family transcriptional regulator